ncbi:MAG: alpha/beta hydrolase [Fimbriimonadaceae bacterium]|nr:MAG: alpha/beta hydrolase [Fimbriimonadaceae bacterium]
MIPVRRYGQSGPVVVLVHGGPGAPGHMSGLAEDLADEFRVLEPFQRGSGEEPLSVARHVEDLHEVLSAVPRPVVMGSSWGAMLALATEGAHPGSSSGLVLVGSGTFDVEARAEMKRRLAEEATPRYRAILEAKARGAKPPLEESAEALFAMYTYDPIVSGMPGSEFDERANRESWDDMLRLQATGHYPQGFAAVRVPVLMLHGENDPHPGAMIRDSLLAVIPHLEYHEWPRCGHYPWVEREHRADFLDRVRQFVRRAAG